MEAPTGHLNNRAIFDPMMSHAVQVGDGDGVDHNKADAEVMRREREDLNRRIASYLHDLFIHDGLDMPSDLRQVKRMAVHAVKSVVEDCENNDLLRSAAYMLEAKAEEARTIDKRMGPPLWVYLSAASLAIAMGWVLGHISR